MVHFPYASYLRTQRDRWLLTQSELGLLLGVSGSVISKYERLTRTPPISVLIGAEFVFGEKSKRIFPGLYEDVELAVTKRAATLAEMLQGKGDQASLSKRALLEAMARRIATEPI
ncbi:MAG: helix-turn-helix transcriptional regulator [Gemmatimonas sp.]